MDLKLDCKDLEEMLKHKVFIDLEIYLSNSLQEITTNLIIIFLNNVSLRK